MKKKTLIVIGCTLIGITIVSALCILTASHLYKRQAIIYVKELKSEYETKLKDVNESIEKLKNEFAQITNKDEELKQGSEEKNKEVIKEQEKKDTTKAQNNSTEKKETPKEKPNNNLPKESSDLLKKARLSNLDTNFWATRLYYMNMALGESQSSANDMLNNLTFSQSEVRNTISEYVQSLNQNYSRFKEVENLGIPSICQSDYQKFKNLYSQYIKSYKTLYNEQSKPYINATTYNKCEAILNELSQVRMRMESKLK